MKTTDPKEQLKLINKVLENDSYEVILGWLQEYMSQKELKNFDIAFKKWLLSNPIIFRKFIEEYEKVNFK